MKKRLKMFISSITHVHVILNLKEGIKMNILFQLSFFSE